MKILVTGGSGFIGRYVIAALEARGHEALIFDRSGGRDILDAEDVLNAVADSDGVIHLAGVLGTGELVDDPHRAVRVNIQGSLNVFEAVHKMGVKCSYISTGNYWMHSPYPITKHAAESLAWMYNREHGTRIAVTRVLSAYGPGQKTHPVRKIIPTFITAALKGEPLTVYGDGSQITDLIWVGDVAEVLVRALLVDHGQYVWEPSRDSQPGVRFEAGTGRGLTVHDIARKVINHAVGGAGSIRYVPMRPGEPEHSVVVGDPSTLEPLYGTFGGPNLRRFEDGLNETIAWYREHRAIAA